MLAAVWLAMLMLGTGSADQQALREVYAGGHPLLISIARVATFLGTWPVGIPVVIVGIALLAWLRGRREAVTAFLVIAVGRILVEVQKYAIGRGRPAIEPHLVRVNTPSFPSGHAGNSMIVCLTFAILFFASTRRRRVAVEIALALSLAIGFTRPVLGVHWPSDVIAGWAFGLLWVLLALPLAERVAR